MRKEEAIDFIVEACEGNGKADFLIDGEWSFCVRRNPYYIFVSLLKAGRTVKTDFIKFNEKYPAKSASDAVDLMYQLKPELMKGE